MRLAFSLFVLFILISSKSFSQPAAGTDTTKGTFELVEVEATFPGNRRMATLP
jgi:hypothetical protein